MLLPLGTDRPLRRPTVINYWLIGLNTALFIAQLFLERLSPQDASHALRFMALGPDNRAPWAFVTYAFAHADFLHLLGNMVVLWVFGGNVEDRFGRAGYLAFYLVGGVIAGAAHILFERASVIGASGAVAAVTAAYLVLFPRTLIRCLLIFFIIGIYWIPAWWFIAFAVAKDMLLVSFSDGVARLAHLAGYFFGAGVCVLLLATKVLAREPYDLFTLGRQAYRRRQFKEAGLQREQMVAKRLDPRRPAGSGERGEEAAKSRAAVSALMAAGDLAGAGEAYKTLADSFADLAGATILSKRHQHELASYFYLARDYQTAAFAFDRFLEAYPRERDAPEVRLILAIINARYLNDPVRAKQLLQGLEHDLPDDSSRAQARGLVEELA